MDVDWLDINRRCHGRDPWLWQVSPQRRTGDETGHAWKLSIGRPSGKGVREMEFALAVEILPDPSAPEVSGRSALLPTGGDRCQEQQACSR